LARILSNPVQLLDCDVEEPNARLFLDGEFRGSEIVSIPIPEVDETLCNACGECGAFCRYHAIVSLKTKPLVFPDMCHGCGGCTLVCPLGAIREIGRPIGVVETFQSGNVTLIHGRLNIGAAMAPPLIRAVKSRLRNGTDAILDAPPGTSCPVITTLRGADLAILVTEPTPFGLHDLKLAVEVVREIAVPFGVVVNRSGIGDDRVQAFCAREEIPVLLEIPDDRRIAEAYSRGEMIVEALPEYRKHFERLLRNVQALDRKKGTRT
ncbi:MAG: ATP-binding protein, partial [Syntrophales bacterium]|nr:ATP-binding protein [Syntrophales bacterium]